MEIIKRPEGARKRALYTIDPVEYDVKKVKGRVAIFDTETDPFAEGRIVKPFTCGFYIPDSGEYFDFWGADCIVQFFAFLSSTFAEQTFTIFVHNGGNFDFYFLTRYFDEGMSPFIINGRLVRITCQGHEFRDSYAMIPVALGNALKSEDGGKIEINYAKLEASYVDSEDDKYSGNNHRAYEAYSEYISRTYSYEWISPDSLTRWYTPREYWRGEILRYQRQDCIALGTLVTEWLELFGNRMTMASVALPALNSFHGFECLSEYNDNEMRKYYFGGRCQAFETGAIKGKKKGYDITSSYPDRMKNEKHPISDTPKFEKRITSRTHFARIRAWSNGALPVRKEDGGLDFPVGTFDFNACIHEIRAGLETGNLRIIKVYESIYFDLETAFDEFIDYFFAERQKADASGDDIRKLFYKLVMNSSYGKFAQDPRRYMNWLFDPAEMPKPMKCEACYERSGEPAIETLCQTCEAKETAPDGWYEYTNRDGRPIYARPQQLRGGRGFFNVATAASITSAARASLLYGIAQCRRPIYCDTDSLICEALEPTEGLTDDKGNERVRVGEKSLGAWKLEFETDELYIAGKKLYACFNNGELVKKASKGVRLTGEQIRTIALGGTVEYANPVPKFSLFKDENVNTRETEFEGVTAEFVTRTIKRT